MNVNILKKTSIIIEIYRYYHTHISLKLVLGHFLFQVVIFQLKPCDLRIPRGQGRFQLIYLGMLSDGSVFKHMISLLCLDQLIMYLIDISLLLHKVAAAHHVRQL